MKPLRASDRHRDGAVAALRRGYLDGQLSTETFEARLAIAHSARQAYVLRALVADLRARWQALHAVLDGPRPAVATARTPQTTLLLSRTDRYEITVGRASTCTVVFGSTAVSRHHARFERVGGRWYVTDLASTNGTCVDGVRVERAPVAPAAEIRLGDALVVVG
ncbi:hypothetical protein DSM104299_03051 [Baekduia alba]|nr:hypothetical protein DSM104299_03051 [Baekduia alba]